MTSRFHNLFWPGFIASFFLLSLASCAGLAAFLGVNRATLAELQNQPQWTPPAAAVEAASAVAEAPSPPSDSSYAPGDQVRNITTSLVNIRRTPGYLGKPGDDILTQIEPGSPVTIVGGPQRVDGLVWWQVTISASSAGPGWVAEATASGVQILGT